MYISIYCDIVNRKVKKRRDIKMKKKVLALFTTLFMLFSFTGCNTEGLSLAKELDKVASWEAIEESGSMNIDMTVAGENVKLAADYTAYSNQKDLQMEMTLTPKSVEASGVKLDLTQGAYKLSPIKMYMDGMKFYVSTSYITELCGLVGLDPSTTVDVSKEYLALDLADTMKASGLDLEALKKSSASSYATYEDFNVQLPIKQEGRNYTVELTSDQMVDSFFGLVIESINSQEDVVKETYKAMGLTDAQVDELLAQVKVIYGDETKAAVKPAIKGSTAKAVFNFEEDKYTTNLSAAIKVTVEDESVDINMTLNDTVKKATKKAIAFPTNVKTYTMEEIMSLATGSVPGVQVAKADVLVQENVVYVPVRSTLTSVGITDITFNGKEATVTLNDLGMAIPVIVKGNTSYTSVATLQGLGINVEII